MTLAVGGKLNTKPTSKISLICFIFRKNERLHTPISKSEAAELEKQHVHEVYLFFREIIWKKNHDYNIYFLFTCIAPTGLSALT